MSTVLEFREWFGEFTQFEEQYRGLVIRALPSGLCCASRQMFKDRLDHHLFTRSSHLVLYQFAPSSYQ